MGRTVKQPEVRRQEILEAALDLFCEKGYEGASMADLAQRLGISQGLCYRYFPSKQALLDCAVDQYAQQQVRILSPVLCDGTKSLRQRMLEMPAPEHYEAGGFYNAFHSESGRRMHQILSVRVCELLTPLVQKQLEHAIRAGEIISSDPESDASFLIWGQLGLLNRFDLPGGERFRRVQQWVIAWLDAAAPTC